jgi:hypothetical protein
MTGSTVGILSTVNLSPKRNILLSTWLFNWLFALARRLLPWGWARRRSSLSLIALYLNIRGSSLRLWLNPLDPSSRTGGLRDWREADARTIPGVKAGHRCFRRADPCAVRSVAFEMCSRVSRYREQP